MRILGVGSPVKIVFEPSFEKDAQPPSKNVFKNSQLGAQHDPSGGPSWLQNRCKRLSKSVLKKAPKKVVKKETPSHAEDAEMGGGPFN